MEIIDSLQLLYKEKNLSINPTKTQELVIKFAHVDPPTLLGNRVKATKILGVLFDDKLTFHEHIEDLAKRANSKVFLLLKLKRFGYERDELALLYNSLVVSTITYGCCVWGGAAHYLLEKIDQVQRRAVPPWYHKKLHPY